MSHLIIHVVYIAHSYSGVRIEADRKEVLDWPPSPARLHEALLSAALTGLPRSSGEKETVWSAFRWVETLSPPIILASPQDHQSRSTPRLAIPQNNPNKSKLHEHSILLAPTLKAVPLTDRPLEVVYQWDVENDALEGYTEILADAAARISYLGRGEDRAEVSLTLVADPPSYPLVRWQPDPGGHTALWISMSGTTDGLEQRHQDRINPRESRSPAQRWMRSVRYSDDSPRAVQPVATAIFQLFPENGDPDAKALSCDPEYSGRWREFFRHQIVELAKDSDNWDDPALAEELLTGHSSPGNPATRPHLAIVPLPSVDAARKADGRVRRVALFGYAAPKIADKAISLYNTLYRALDDLIVTTQTPLRRSGENVPVRMKLCDPGNDPILHHLAGKSRLWCSVIPVAISRGFRVPKFHPDGRPMSANERHHRKLREWSELLRASLRHVGLAPELVAACVITPTPTPLIPKSQRAEKYRAPGESAVLTHVRLEFPAQVRGPLILGDRRYVGFGLLVPNLDATAAPRS